MNWTIEQIEHYILGTLPEDTLSAFDKELNENVLLRSEVTFYTDLIKGIQRKALKEELDRIHKKQNRKGGKGLAFLLLVMVGIGFGAYNYYFQSNSELTPYRPTKKSEMIKDSTKLRQDNKAHEEETVNEPQKSIVSTNDTTSSLKRSYDTIRIVKTEIRSDSVDIASKVIIVQDENDLTFEIEEEPEEISPEPKILDTINDLKINF